MSDYPEILTLEQAALFLQVSTRTVQRLVAEGRIPGRQVGSQWRFDRDQLRAWIRGKETSQSRKLSQRELVEKERDRLGVDLPETLLDMQQELARRRSKQSDDEGKD